MAVRRLVLVDVLDLDAAVNEVLSFVRDPGDSLGPVPFGEYKKREWVG
jgi:hypothetical protein